MATKQLRTTYQHLANASALLRDAVREIENAAGAYSPGEARRIAYDALLEEAERLLRTTMDYRDDA